MTTRTPLTLVGLLALALPVLAQEGARTVRASDIHIRDPWIMPYEGTYYLVGTTGDAWGKEGGGFEAYTSTDLIEWTPRGPVLQFDDPPTWVRYHFWAPELVSRKGKFWLFYSGKTDTTCRGTGVAVADSPLGPFHNVSDRPLTPTEWECLDGHLFTDTDGSEWLIYVHEWVQAPVGEMWAQRIADDYTALVGEKHLLFQGRDAAWSNNVIDGPMMVVRDGRYFLFWSSFSEAQGYNAGYAVADSSMGPYTQSPSPVIGSDGGHNCVFGGFDGKLYTSFHQPNRGPDERLAIYELLYDAGQWRLGECVE